MTIEEKIKQVNDSINELFIYNQDNINNSNGILLFRDQMRYLINYILLLRGSLKYGFNSEIDILINKTIEFYIKIYSPDEDLIFYLNSILFDDFGKCMETIDITSTEQIYKPKSSYEK